MRFRPMLVAGALWMLGRAALAADPQAYSVHIDATGNAALDSTLHASSQLDSLRTTAPVGPFALIGRAQQDIGRLRTALESFGYYRSAVNVTIDGKTLEDPTLPDQLQALPRDSSAKVDVHIDAGPLYHLRKVSLEGEVSAKAAEAFGLQSGAPAVAAEVLAARQRLFDALQEEGHAFARVDEPVAYEDTTEPVLDVSFQVDAGPVANIGEISFVGLERMHEAFLRRRLLLHTGELYRPSQIELARTDLLALGVFSGITIRPPTQADAQGRVPIIFDVKERPLYAITLNANYSSDLGASAGAAWSDRNLFGNAEQLNLNASLIDLGGTATTNFGYNGGAQLIKPDFMLRNQALQFNLGALKQSLVAYDQTAVTAGTSLSRQLSSVWKASAGAAVEEEQICQEQANRNYVLLSLPLNVGYDSTDRSSPLVDPTHGLIGALSVTPTESLPTSGASACSAGGATSGSIRQFSSASYVAMQFSLSGYLDLSSLHWTQPGRSVLALRALAAQAFGRGLFAGDPSKPQIERMNLPPDQRFYAGGSNTVRGYIYQSVGPLYSDGIPAGGIQLHAFGAEFRQRLWGNFGTAVFVDAGDATIDNRPFAGKYYLGYGLGLRYYTPIGPVRVDVGVPQQPLPQPNRSVVEVYVGLGQAF